MHNWLKALSITIVSFLAPIHTVMLACGSLIVIDLITGVWAAKKRGETINSAALRRTVSKILAYEIAIISGYILQKYLLEDILPVMKLAASAIGLVETISVLENVNSITGSSIFTALIKKLGSQNDQNNQ